MSISASKSIVGLTIVAAAACASALPGPPDAPQPAAAFSEVAYPPPPARPEQVPEQPAADAMWIDGEWSWRGRHWRWVLGRWVRMPAPGARFALTRWRWDDSGMPWWAPGSWYSDNGEPLEHPRALANAEAGEGDVIDEDGRTVDVTPNRQAPNSQAPNSQAPNSQSRRERRGSKRP